MAVSNGEWVDVLLVVDESSFPNSCSTVIESVGIEFPIIPPATRVPPPTTGDPAPPPILSGFCKLAVEKFIVPASPGSIGRLILLSRTCCSRSASRSLLWSPPKLSIQDLRRFSV